MGTQGDTVEFLEVLRPDQDAPAGPAAGGPTHGRMPRAIAVLAFAALVVAALPTAWLMSGNGGAQASQSPVPSEVAVGPSEYASSSDDPTDTLSYEPFTSAEDSPGDEPTDTASATAAGASAAPRPACATQHYTVDPSDFGPDESPIVDIRQHTGSRAICGVITGPSGERVRQVGVSFMPTDGHACSGCETVTDAQGRYSIAVPPGRFHVFFGGWDTKYAGGHLSPHGASYGDTDPTYAVVDVRSADAVVNIRLQRMVLAHLTVHDQDGLPVQGVWCELVDGDLSYHEAKSGADGRCVIPLQYLGPFTLRFDDPSARFAPVTIAGTYKATAGGPDLVIPAVTLPFRLTPSAAPTDPPATDPPATDPPPSSPEESPSA